MKNPSTNQPTAKTWFILFLSLLSFTSVRGAIIGYTNALQVTSVTQHVMDQIAGFKWFFAHASVGENLMSGLQGLHSSDAAFYSLTRSSVPDGPPPSPTLAGIVYDLNRGNPGWKAKVDLFASSISNGWHFPQVNIAMNKFCWIDPDADFAYYTNSMSLLEGAYPQTWFVYTTIPLTPDEDRDNYRRSVFNEALRSWATNSPRLLYDIADMEAHDTNGVEQTFVYEGRVCQKQYSGYTDDGGHLTTVAAQRIAGAGFYALGAALLGFDRDADGMPDTHELAMGFNPLDAWDAALDPDGDGMTNLQEYLAGTDPHDPASVFTLWISQAPVAGIEMHFVATANVTYEVQFSQDATANSWQTTTNVTSETFQREITIHMEPELVSQGLYRVIARRGL